MSKLHLEVDISELPYEPEDEDIIEIHLSDEAVFQVDIFKLFILSKYIRMKYNYLEINKAIQFEFENVEQRMKVSKENIKRFIDIIQKEKVTIPLEHYKDLYILSEYFKVQKLTRKLDTIRENELFIDVDFTIQTLIDISKLESDEETKMTSKIENFLSLRINECFKNEKFGELPNSVIYRILGKSDKESLNANALTEFILAAAESRFVLFRFVELHSLTEDEMERLIDFIESQPSQTKELCKENLPLDLMLIRQMKSKYKELTNKLAQKEEELSKTKEKLNRKEEELSKTKEKLNKTKEELSKTDEELNRKEEELSKTKEELSKTDEELNRKEEELSKTKEELSKTDEELSKTKEELSKTDEELNRKEEELSKTNDELGRIKNDFDRIKSAYKQYAQSIIACGYNKYSHLGVKPNNKTKDGTPVIHPPLKSSVYPSSLLSYSVYSDHSVAVSKSGSLLAVGDNSNGSISSSLAKESFSMFTEFSIKDSSGRHLQAVSAACTTCSTLYMLSKSGEVGLHLVYCSKDVNGGDPIFLDIGDHQPVALFGYCFHSAAITSEGEVIFINRDSDKKSPIQAFPLPGGKKASCVAYFRKTVVALSSCGRVFASPVEEGSCVLRFSAVPELADQEIVCVSGISSHCLAVSKEGRVFGCGSNQYGQLGLGKGTGSFSSFTLISSLGGYEIKAAYAGNRHSLFQTRGGKIIACGYNNRGQLHIDSGPCEECVYKPTEAEVEGNVTFCIAGCNLSLFFIDGDPPPNTPNQKKPK